MIEDIRKDVERLISAYERIRAEYGHVSEELRKCKSENEACKERIVELERQIDNFELQRAFGASADNGEAKERIDGIIKEIRKCISMMEG